MRVVYAELAGRKYPLCCSLSAIERIEEEFGSVEGMGEALSSGLSGGYSGMIRAIETALGIFLDAGRAYAAAVGEEAPPPLPGRIADVISLEDDAAQNLILEVIASGNKRQVEAAAKNGGAAAEAAAPRGSTTPEAGRD